MVFSPDSALVVAMGDHGFARVWDAATGTILRSLPTDSSDHYSASFSPDGTMLAVAGESGTVRLFDARSWELVRELDTGDRLRGAVFCPDRKTLVTNGTDPFVRIWDLEAGSSRAIATGVGTMYPLACHPDGGRIGVAGPGAATQIVDLETGAATRLVGHSRNEDVNRITLTPDGEFAVTASDDGTVRTWYVEDGRPFWRAPFFDDRSGVGFTHEGWRDLRDERSKPRPSAQAWEKAVEERAREAEAPNDATHLCIRTHDAKVAIWDLAADRQLAEVPLDGLARVAAFPGGCLALAGDKAFTVDLAGKTEQIAEKATAIAWDEDAILVAADREARLFSQRGKLLRTWKTDVGPTALKRVGPWLAVGYGDGAVELQPTDGEKTAPILRDRIATPVTRIDPGPAGTLLASHENGGLGLWSLADGARLDAWYVHGPVRHLLFDGALVRAVSELGDRMEIDLSVYTRPYCELLREVWEEVPVVWESGQAVRRAPPKDHPCAAR